MVDFRMAEPNITVSATDSDTITDTVARELYRPLEESTTLAQTARRQ